LIELLVVISIIATLMSLILPAIQNAREAGRRTQCLNNIRNVTLAALNFASSNKSRLPSLSVYIDNPGTTALDNMGQRSWVVDLLPHLDQQGTYDRWDKTLVWDSTAPSPTTGATNRDLAEDLYMEVLVCPNDESSFQIGGGLTYVANGGFGDGVSGTHSFTAEGFDWNADGTNASDAEDDEITQDTGVFWSEFATNPNTRNASASVGKIYDGSGNTLMFAENINAGQTRWSDPDFNSCAFILPLTGGTSTAVGLTNGVPAAASTQVDNAAMYDPTSAILTGTTPFINQKKTGPEGAPFINSLHPGIAVVSFCDGSASTLSESMDKKIYAALVTPSGTRQRTLTTPAGWAAEQPVSATDF
ncbi:MAG: DUF1559 domain-containing protein, partial [Planctomycetaceae bacterium]|nr:DUF1559 domain-containing protein [Planctomycetaceae bacterium]